MELTNIINLNNQLLAAIEVGEHFYWEIGKYKVHGQVFMVSWFVIGVLLIASIAATRNVQRIPSGFQNFMEYVLDFFTQSHQRSNWRKRISSMGSLYRYSIFIHFRI